MTTARSGARTRRRLWHVVAVGAVLAGCGSNSVASPSTQESSTATAPAGFPLTVDHAMGSTTVPAQPERVVVLDTGELDSMAALGIEPVGAVRAPVEEGFLDYLSDDTEGTELVGTIDAPNLEAIAALRPDLILSSSLRHEDLYDELSQIAPTVFTDTVGVVWKDNFIVHATAVGERDRAEQMLAEYEQRADALGAQLSSDGSLPSVSVLRFMPAATRLYQKASFIGTVLDDAGFPRPASQDVDEFALEISAEQLDLADADVVFVTAYGPIEDTAGEALMASPLWNGLEAVQQDRVYQVPDDHWMLGIGIGAANLVLDDLERLLGESNPTTERAFPVTIDHAFGATTIAGEPTRVVTWGWGSTDAALSLGVAPVAMPYFSYGGDQRGVLPWVADRLDADGLPLPQVLPDVQDPPFEAIAAAQPDLILAPYSGITSSDYQLLSEIAPTVAYPDEPWATPWRDTVAIVGRALGRQDQAQQLLADIDARIEERAAAHPELQGRTVALVWDTADMFYVYKPADPRVEFTEALGLVSAPSVEALANGDSSFYYTLSRERLDELTSDILVSYATDAETSDAFLRSPAAQLLEQVQRGSVAEVIGTEVIAAVSPPTALSLTWGLDQYIAALSEAARGLQPSS